MTYPRSLTAEQRAATRARFRAGKSLASLSALLGVSTSYLRNVGGCKQDRRITKYVYKPEPDDARVRRPPASRYPGSGVDHIDLARRYAAGEFDAMELRRRLRGG